MNVIINRMENVPHQGSSNKLHFLQNIIGLSALTLIVTVWATVTFLAYQNKLLEKYSKDYSIPIPTSKKTESDPFKDWHIYKNEANGIAFRYPKDYLLEENTPMKEVYYVSIMSPPDVNKAPKETTVNSKELKIEFVIEASKTDDSVEICYKDHSAGENYTKIINKTNITIAGIDSIRYAWQGVGTGEFACMIKNGRRYIVNKYPIKTERQEEYDQILSTLILGDTNITPTPQNKNTTNEQDGCKIGGCNSEICTNGDSEEIVSICIYKEEFACYKTAVCKKQSNGKCGWTQTDELIKCLQQTKNNS